MLTPRFKNETSELKSGPIFTVSWKINTNYVKDMQPG